MAGKPRFDFAPSFSENGCLTLRNTWHTFPKGIRNARRGTSWSGKACADSRPFRYSARARALASCFSSLRRLRSADRSGEPRAAERAGISMFIPYRAAEMPASYFEDGFCLNPQGAGAFTERLSSHFFLKILGTNLCSRNKPLHLPVPLSCRSLSYDQ